MPEYSAFKIVCALAWSAQTILNAEYSGTRQPGREGGGLKGKIVSPMWIKGGAMARAGSRTPTDARRRGKRVHNDSTFSTSTGKLSSARTVAPAVGALSAPRRRSLTRHHSDPLPRPAKLPDVDRLDRAHWGPPGKEDVTFSYEELQDLSTFTDMTEMVCARLKVSHFRLWRNRPLWRSLRLSLIHI